jgi:hypothetical protein
MNNILVTGAPRSGTTFLGEMLNLSGQVLYVWEPFNSNFRKGVKYYYPYWGKSTNLSKTNYLTKLINDTLVFKNLEGAVKISKNDDLIRYLFKSVGINRTKLKYFVTKLKYNFINYDNLLIKDPIAIFLSELLITKFDFRVVVCVRSPGPIIKSRINLGWDFDFSWWLNQNDFFIDHIKGYIHENRLNSDDTIFKSCMHWNLIYEYINKLKNKYPEKLIVIKQEELIVNPVNHVRDLYNELNINYSELNDKVIKKFTSASKKKSQNNNVSKIISRNVNNLNDWENFFSESEKNKILRLTKNTFDLYYK